MNKQVLVVILLFAGAVIAGRFLSGPSEIEVVKMMPVACEPSVGPCLYPIEEVGKVEFSLHPRENIKPMQPLQAEVRLPAGWKAESVTMTGVNMNMGVNRFEFSPSGGGNFTAQLMLPACIADFMEWQAALRLNDGNKSWQVPFRFKIFR